MDATLSGSGLHYLSAFSCRSRNTWDQAAQHSTAQPASPLVSVWSLMAHAFLTANLQVWSPPFQKPLVTCPTSGDSFHQSRGPGTACPTPSSRSLTASSLRGLISGFWEAALLLTGCTKGRNATKKVGLKTGQVRACCPCLQACSSWGPGSP